MLVHVVADYGPAGDLAFAEVAQRLLAELPGATIVATRVGPFDTLAAGFVVAQLALMDGPAERVVFHNVAPRRDEATARRANEGERFTAAEAPNGRSSSVPTPGTRWRSCMTRRRCSISTYQPPAPSFARETSFPRRSPGSSPATAAASATLCRPSSCHASRAPPRPPRVRHARRRQPIIALGVAISVPDRASSLGRRLAECGVRVAPRPQSSAPTFRVRGPPVEPARRAPAT